MFLLAPTRPTTAGERTVLGYLFLFISYLIGVFGLVFLLMGYTAGNDELEFGKEFIGYGWRTIAIFIVLLFVRRFVLKLIDELL
jgi:hypothetical protein